MKSWLPHPVLGFLQKYPQARFICFFPSLLPFPNDFRNNGEGFATVGALYMLKVTPSADYRIIVMIKRICLFYQIYDGLPITVFDGRNIFLISFTPFYVLVELRPAFTFIVEYCSKKVPCKGMISHQPL